MKNAYRKPIILGAQELPSGDDIIVKFYGSQDTLGSDYVVEADAWDEYGLDDYDDAALLALLKSADEDEDFYITADELAKVITKP